MPTRESFTAWDNMAPLSNAHLLSLVVVALLILSVPLVIKKCVSDTVGRWLGFTAASISATGYLAWVVAAVIVGAFDPHRDLPLEFCYLVGLVAPFALWSDRQWVFDFFYYCAMSGVLHACITPVDVAVSPHPRFFAFWALHGGVLVTVAFALSIWGKRPTYRGIFTTLGILIAMLGIIIPINFLTGSNYFYLAHQPSGTILETLGPMPWNIVFLIAYGFVHSQFTFLPFATKSRQIHVDEATCC